MARRPRATRNKAVRLETDSFGPIAVAADKYWGAQTERSRQNFRIGSERMPLAIIHALALVKLAAAETNRGLRLLDKRRADAISRLKASSTTTSRSWSGRPAPAPRPT
jgi:fumarate hydratase class II